MAKVDYAGDFGEKTIGCFEIDPDADHPAADGENSSGGDSGAVWSPSTKSRNAPTSASPPPLHKGDKLLAPEAAAAPAPLENLSDINWD
ncbi:hypothetical protein [Streptomyces olivochromogenes]|uniref:hypothetical protein n=1 Tax=Streptomyces olivochromogenes TaxID=1963 RepID=UPI0036A91D5B